jgi:two-component system response regulator HydG
VAEGTFRRDLYYRLNVLTLRIPPLRDRKSDIPFLTEYFMERLARITGVRRSISDEAMKMMMNYDWPGNVRELENCLERTATLSSGPLLHVADLPSSVQNAGEAALRKPTPRPSIVPLAQLERDAILSAIQQLGGDKLQAARMLGIGKTTLYRKLKEYALE